MTQYFRAKQKAERLHGWALAEVVVQSPFLVGYPIQQGDYIFFSK